MLRGMEDGRWNDALSPLKSIGSRDLYNYREGKHGKAFKE